MVLFGVIVAKMAAAQCADYALSPGPQTVGSADTPGTALGVAISGAYAFIADHGSGMIVIDITNPASPQIVGNFNASPSAARDVAISGTYAYVADESAGLQVIDITNPVSPQIVGSADTPGYAMSVAISGSYAYVADNFAGLQIVDITDPGTPHLVGGTSTVGHAYCAVAAGTYVYVAADVAGLQVIDIMNPTSPQIVGSVDTPGVATGVAVVGSHAYVADGATGLLVIDVADPANPQIVGAASTPGYAHGVAASTTHAYVADELPGLRVIDIANPTEPVFVGSVATPSAARDVVISGAHAFVAAEASGLQILPLQCGDSQLFAFTLLDVPHDQGGQLRISWRKHPADAISAASPVTSYDVQRFGEAWLTISTMSAASADSYTTIVNTPDIVIEGQPAPLSSYRIVARTTIPWVFYESGSGSAYSIDNLPPPKPMAFLVEGTTYRYVTWTDPELPDLGSTCVYRGEASGFTPGVPLACPVNFYTETHLGWYFYRVQFSDVHGNLSALSDELHGQWPTPVPNAVPHALKLYPCQPNPFNPHTTIRFYLPEAGSARLSVFDVAGRLVRTLVDDSMPQGGHEAAWDGRDSSGREVGSGSYLARLEFGGEFFDDAVGIDQMNCANCANRVSANPS